MDWGSVYGRGGAGLKTNEGVVVFLLNLHRGGREGKREKPRLTQLRGLLAVFWVGHLGFGMGNLSRVPVLD